MSSGVLVIRVDEIGPDGEGFTEVLRAVRDVVPPGGTVWGAIREDAEAVLALFGESL